MTKLLIKLFTVYMAIFLGICCVPIDHRTASSLIFSSDANAAVNCTGSACEHSDGSDVGEDPAEEDNLIVFLDYLMILAVGITAGIMIVACKTKAYSTWIFIISGVCFILAEIMGQMNYKAAAEEALQFSLSNVEGYKYTSETQRFNDAIEQTKEAKKAVEEKKGHLEAVKAGFLIGFIVNLVEVVYCKTYGKVDAKTCVTAMQICDSSGFYSASEPKNLIMPPMFFSDLISILRPASHKLPVILSQQNQRDNCSNKEENLFDLAMGSLDNLTEKIANLIFGKKAHAFMTPEQVTINLGITLALIYPTLFAVSTPIMKFTSNTNTRLLVFIMSGLMAQRVLMKLEDQIKKLEKRIEAYNEMITRINKALLPDTTVPCPSGSERVNGVCSTDGPDMNRNTLKIAKYKAKKGKNGACLNQTGSVDPNCICKKNNSCKKMPSPPPVSSKFAGQIPANLNNLSQSLSNTGTALATGNLAKANSSAQKVSSSIGKLGKMKNKMLAKLIKSDKRFKNIEKIASNKLKKFKNNIFAKIKKKGHLAALKSAAINGPSGTLPKAEDVKDKILKKKSASSGSGSKGSGKSGSDPLAGFEDQNEKDKEVDLFKDEAETLNEFEESYDDINKKSDVSIWLQLSTRYLKKYNTFYEENLTPKKKGE